MDITLYTINKRINSTKQPSGGTTISGTLKDSTSVMNPSFKITMDDSIVQYNYLSAWGRYYWITDIISLHNNLWLVQCGLDALATCKGDIQGSTCYVAYSATDFNLYIPDNRMVMRNQRTVQYTKQVVQILSEDGVYAFSSIGNDVSSNGFCNFYLLTRQNLGKIAKALLDDKGFLVQAKEWFSSALDTIVGCHWLPLTFQGTGGTTVKLGDFNTGVPATYYDDNTVETTFPITINWQNNYLDGSPYKSMALYLPYIGVIELSPSDFWRDTIQVKCVVDVHTGDIVYKIGTGSINNTVATFSGNCACEIPVSTYKTELGAKVSTMTQGFNNAASTVGNVASALTGKKMDKIGALTAAAGGLSAGIQNTFDTMTAMFKKTPSMIGGFGGAAGVRLGTDAVLIEMQNLTSESITAKQSAVGLPCYKTRSLSGLSGYVQTVGASVRTSLSNSVDQVVNEALDGGIYIE